MTFKDELSVGEGETAIKKVKDEIADLLRSEGVLDFQKRVMFSQMNVYKRYNVFLKEKLNEATGCQMDVKFEEEDVEHSLRKRIAELEGEIKMLECDDGGCDRENLLNFKRVHRYGLDDVKGILSDSIMMDDLTGENLEYRRRLMMVEYANFGSVETLKTENKAAQIGADAFENMEAFLNKELVSLESRASLFKKNLRAIFGCYSEKLSDEITSMRAVVDAFRKKMVPLQAEIERLTKERDALFKKFGVNYNKYRHFKNVLAKMTVPEVQPSSDSEILEELVSLFSSYKALLEKYKALVVNVDRQRNEIDYHIVSKARLISEISAMKDSLKLSKMGVSGAFSDSSQPSSHISDPSAALKEVDHALDCAVTDNKDITRENLVMKEEIARLEKRLVDAECLIDKHSDEVAELQLRIMLLDVDNKNLRKLVDAYFGGRSLEMVDNAEKYKKLLECTVCGLNYKDTVILSCMHVFCRDCINAWVKARKKRCYICGEPFSRNDIRRIYL